MGMEVRFDISPVFMALLVCKERLLGRLFDERQDMDVGIEIVL